MPIFSFIFDRFETTKEYVTDKTKGDIKNGSILKFCHSPQKIVSELMDKLTGASADHPDQQQQQRLMCLKGLESHVSDYAVAEELVRSNGIQTLIDLVVSEGHNASFKARIAAFV